MSRPFQVMNSRRFTPSLAESVILILSRGLRREFHRSRQIGLKRFPTISRLAISTYQEHTTVPPSTVYCTPHTHVTIIRFLNNCYTASGCWISGSACMKTKVPSPLLPATEISDRMNTKPFPLLWTNVARS